MSTGKLNQWPYIAFNTEFNWRQSDQSCATKHFCETLISNQTVYLSTSTGRQIIKMHNMHNKNDKICFLLSNSVCTSQKCIFCITLFTAAFTHTVLKWMCFDWLTHLMSDKGVCRTAKRNTAKNSKKISHYEYVITKAETFDVFLSKGPWP